MGEKAINHITCAGIIAILRASSSQALIDAAMALKDGGITAIEVTMTTPGALQTIEKASEKFTDEILFGAGSILDPESARAAILAGARFIVMPTTNLRVIELCRRYSTLVLPGAYTPTEIISAWEAGADMVKLFPASVGGPDMVRALLAPLPQVKLVPVGGIDIDNVASYIRAGAVAVGAGSSLVNDRLLKEKNFDEVTIRAQKFLQQVQTARSG
jgi:2-dehydro-3-deoxyphosphogluconate aldolase / (4S)-4-hydroxy-2-oxoglutarate aldolase